MNDTSMYVIGTSGFKPAVKSKLGEKWIQRCSDKSDDTLMFLLPAEIDAEAFKALIGEKLISSYSLQFNIDLEKYTRTEKPYSMTIWANNESKVKERGTQKPQRDPTVPVF